MLTDCGKLGSAVRCNFIELAICSPLTLSRMGGAKRHAHLFFPSTNVRINSQNFLTFSFNPFAPLG